MVKAKASALRRSIDIQNQFGIIAVKQAKKKCIFSNCHPYSKSRTPQYGIEYMHCLFAFVTSTFENNVNNIANLLRGKNVKLRVWGAESPSSFAITQNPQSEF